MGLTGTRYSPVPDSFAILRILNYCGIESVCIDALLDLEILFNGDESFIHTFFRSKLQDLEVTLAGVTLNILASRLDSELPGSVNSGVFL